MKQHQLLISIEVITVITVLTGIGAFIYFVNPSIPLPFVSRRSEVAPTPSPQTEPPAEKQPPTASPTPDYSDLLSKPANKVGIVTSTEGQIIRLTDQNGEEFQLTLNEDAVLDQILPNVITDPPTTKPISPQDLDEGDALSIYLDDHQDIRAVFVVKKS